MSKILSLRLLPLILLLSIPISQSFFVYNNHQIQHHTAVQQLIISDSSLDKKEVYPQGNDPIRFDISTNQRQVTIGQEVELTITARLLNISPNLMFFLPGSNAYTLHMLFPANFQRTGGSLSDYVTGQLNYPDKAEATYIIRGFFNSPANNACFRLLRSDGQATEQSLYVEKATLCMSVCSIGESSARIPVTNSLVNWCVEAESGSGNRGVASSGQASAGQYIGGFGNSGEYMNYSITGVPSAGSYTLHLWYASGENPQFGLVVNGTLQTASAPSNGNWSGPFAEKTISVSLQSGTNTLRVQGVGGGGFSLDRLCVDGGTTSCTPPSLSLGAPACNGTATYSVPFTAQAGATVSSSAGSVQGSQVVNVPVGTNLTLTASLNGCSAQQTDNSPTCSPTSSTGYARVMIVGNSITHHPSIPGWPKDWGMDASAPSKDYKHILTEYLQTLNSNVQVREFADFPTLGVLVLLKR